MPPERHPAPSPRPPRDRHSGPGGFGGQRRSFGQQGHGGPPRDSGPRPPFAPRPPFQPSPPLHALRLRDGERELEVSGTPEFVRQIVDDLPSLLARLHGEANPGTHHRPASISLPPPPPAAEPQSDVDHHDDEPAPPPAAEAPRRNGRVRHNGKATLEDRVFDLLAHADHPLSVASIRKQLGSDESGQQIRRILERASDRVYSTDERPAAYALR